ncbi:aminotransferase class III-fold pyridoxal phosphate-dependent enzyme [Oceanospirillum sediminis]
MVTFAFQQYGIIPHIMTLGKGLGGGVPVSALLSQDAISCFDYGDQGGTYNGNPLMCAVASAVLEQVLQPEFMSQVQQAGRYLKQQLEVLSRQFNLGRVRGKGLLLALDTGALHAPDLVSQALKHGLLLNAPTDNALRFMPALNIDQASIDQMILLLTDILKTTTTSGVNKEING